jgi:hypothetical protein
MPSTSNASNSARGSSRYPGEIRRQAAELSDRSLPEHKTRQATTKRDAGLLGVNGIVLVRYQKTHKN